MPDDVRELTAVRPPTRSTSADPDKTMTQERCDHLALLNSEIIRRVSEKYSKGQAEHGGNLWEKPGILDMAIDEAIDQLVYLLTLKTQRLATGGTGGA